MALVFVQHEHRILAGFCVSPSLSFLRASPRSRALPQRFFPNGGDWASGAALRQLFVGGFAGGRNPLGMLAPSLLFLLGDLSSVFESDPVLLHLLASTLLQKQIILPFCSYWAIYPFVFGSKHVLLHLLASCLDTSAGICPSLRFPQKGILSFPSLFLLGDLFVICTRI